MVKEVLFWGYTFNIKGQYNFVRLLSQFFAQRSGKFFSRKMRARYVFIGNTLPNIGRPILRIKEENPSFLLIALARACMIQL